MEKTQILIVEDDLDLAEMLSAYFRVQNYDVFTAAWGRDAIDLSQKHNLQLIVLDIRLPDIDGYEVCRHLRTQRHTQDVPIIFLTEKRDRVDKLQGLELGVVDYITKPFDIQELRLRVRNAINKASRPSLFNPVTDLPEGNTVTEKLENLLVSEKKWAILQIGIGISRFRELYGFVAADDVLRAVTLMVRNAVREHGSEDDYIGHLNNEDFVIITSVEQLPRIQERIETRIRQSREYFFPAKDREKIREDADSDHLQIKTAVVDHTTGKWEDADELITALNTALKAETGITPASKTGEVPKIDPDKADTPETPDKADTEVKADTPDTSDKPDTAAKADTPDKASTPDTSDKPDAAAKADTPDKPDTKDEPGKQD